MSRRFLIVSDIHSNYTALEAVLEDAEKQGPFERKYCLGDIVGYGPFPNECVKAVRDEGFISVLGNHDRVIRNLMEVEEGRELTTSETIQPVMLQQNPLHKFNFYAAAAARDNAKQLTGRSLKYLKQLSNRPVVDSDGGFAVVHGSFAGTENGEFGSERFEDIYIRYETEIVDALRALSYMYHNEINIGIVGHTHIPMVVYCPINSRGYLRKPYSVPYVVGDAAESSKRKRASKTIVLSELGASKPSSRRKPTRILVNPGSVGQPRHLSPRASYGILEVDDNKTSFHFRYITYDVRKTQKEMMKRKFPKQLIDRLAVGR